MTMSLLHLFYSNMISNNFLSHIFLTTLLLYTLVTVAQSTHTHGRALGASFIPDFLNSHNNIRAKYGLRPLQWSTKLASFAKSYANQRRKDCMLVHSNSNYGENLFWGKGKKWKASDAVGAWFAEKSSYDYKKHKCYANKDCLHYTQLVWRTTLRVGCARITCNRGDTFIICNYDPHGNIMGERPY